jgi:hypothetical protein
MGRPTRFGKSPAKKSYPAKVAAGLLHPFCHISTALEGCRLRKVAISTGRCNFL